MRDFRSIPLQELKETDLEALVAAEAEESRVLDAKREMYDVSGSGKREFLKDASAFANTAGGDILVGVAETNGIIAGVPGIDGDADAFLLRLEQILNNSVTPRITGAQFHKIPLRSGRFVIAIRIPRSWLGPHRVELEDYRFWYRVGRGNERMDVDQLRAAFLDGPEFAERARIYRADRVAKIASNLGPIRLRSKSALIIHVLPRDAFSDNLLNASILSGQVRELQVPGSAGIQNVRFNLEGICGYGGNGGDASSYVHLGRNGIYEGVKSDIIVGEEKWRYVLVNPTEIKIRDAVWNAFKVLSALNRELPYNIFVSLAGVNGISYMVDRHSFGYEPNNFDRDVVFVSEQVIYGIPVDRASLSHLLSPLLDEIANAAGLAESPRRG